jgi:hypothetical protein
MWKLLRKLCLKNIIAILIIFTFLELLYQYSEFIEDFLISVKYIKQKGVVVVIVFLQLPVQSMSITTDILSSNPAHGKVYSIQHYVIKFVSDFQQVSGFLQVLWFSSTNKTDRHDITEILLKVTFNTITRTLTPYYRQN